MSLAASEADQVLEALRAANQARQEQAKAQAAWALEQQQLKLLIAESRRQQERIKQQIKKDAQVIKDKQKSLKHFDSQAQQSLALDTVLLEMSKHCHSELDQRARSMTHGSIAAPGKQAADPAMQFLHAAARLQQSVNNSREWHVSLSDGLLNDKPYVCEILRMGNACAWWASRDGKRAGIVKRKDGKNILIPITDTKHVVAIQAAVAIVHGDRAPALIALPIPQAAQQ